MYETVAWIAGGIIALWLLVTFNRRRKPALQQAYQTFDPISQACGAELKRLSEVFDRARETIGDASTLRERGFAGESKELGELILRQVDGLEAMSAEMQRVLAECESLLHPTSPLAQAANMLTTSRYLHCINVIQGKSFQATGFPAEQESKTGWIDFEAFLALTKQRRDLTIANLQRFEEDLSRAGKSVQALQQQLESISEIQAKIDAIRTAATPDNVRRTRNDRQWLHVPLLYEQLLPALEDEAENVAQEADKDPVGVQEKRIPSLTQKLGQLDEVIRAIARVSGEDVQKIEAARKTLQDAGFSIRWIERRQREIEDQLQQFVSKSVRGEPVAELADGFIQDLQQFFVRVSQCTEMAQKMVVGFEPELDRIEAELENARKVIADRIGISDILTLRESGYSPDDELQRARQQFIAVKAALGRGDIDAANAAFGEIEVESQEATRFIEDSLLALDEFPGKVELRNSQLDKLQQRMPRLEASLDAAEALFDRNALEVVVDEAEPTQFTVQSVPAADDESDRQGTKTKSLIDLSRVAESWLRDAGQGIQAAEREFQRGQILVACNEVDLFESELSDLESFMDRLEARINFVRELASENQQHIVKAVARLEQVQESVREKTTSESTFPQTTKALQQLQDNLRTWRLGGDDTSRNPLQDRQRINLMRQSLDEIESLLQTEDRAFHETMDALQGVEQEMKIARILVKNSIDDGVPDSQQISQDQQSVQAMEQRLVNLKRQLERDDTDWEQVDRDATQLQIELSWINGRLRNEITAARNASEAIQSAAGAVFQAAQWQGPFGIVVVGRPGATHLNQARVALSQGEYTQAGLLAREAERHANNGLVAAQAQAARARRDSRQKQLRRERMRRDFWN